MLNLTVLWNRKDNNTFENIPQYYQTLRIQQVMIILQIKKMNVIKKNQLIKKIVTDKNVYAINNISKQIKYPASNMLYIYIYIYIYSSSSSINKYKPCD